jgi:hypothetical protein
MQQGDAQSHGSSPVGGYRSPHSSVFDGRALGRVVEFRGHYAVIAGSPLLASQPGCAGDAGFAGQAKVVDVVEDEGGLLHITDGALDAEPGDLILITRDSERRERLERAHAAFAVALAELIGAGIEIRSVEIVAGMAWIEVIGPAPRIDLPALCAAGELLQVRPQRNGRMSVRIGEREVCTYFAPIARSTLEIGGAALRPVAELEEGRELLEVSLPDGEGRAWWL